MISLLALRGQIGHTAATPSRPIATTDVFAQAAAAYDVANSQADLSTAKQAITDGDAAQASAFQAIQNKAGPRVTGGGQFGTLNGTRNSLVLGQLGGLATANRAAFNTQAKVTNLVERNATDRVAVLHDNPGLSEANADAALTPAGYAQTFQGPSGSYTKVIKYDDAGNANITFR